MNSLARLKYIQLEKFSSAAEATRPAGDPATHKYGQRNDTGHSLPVGYLLEGWLVAEPAVGTCVEVLRCVRNNLERAGTYTSTPIVETWPGGFRTANSVYRWREIEPDNNAMELRHELEEAGAKLVRRMVDANHEFIADAANTAARAGFSRRTLRDLCAAGRVIAYQPDGAAEELFPQEQFVHGDVEPWAAEIVRAVGSGAPALHFIYVRRRSLGGYSFAEELRRAPGSAHVAELIRNAISKLTGGDPG